MVKQGSFFQRLKERFASGPGVRVDSSKPNPASLPPRTHPAASRATAPLPAGAPKPAAPPMPRVEPEPVVERAQPVRDLATDFAPVEARSTRKLNEREEAMLAIGSHFQELTALLRGSQTRVDDQLTQLVQATSALVSLPGLSQQQLDALRGMAAQLERQNALGEQLATTMTKLPSLLTNVEQALARAAATDERTAQTVREFQATMDRIHGAMHQMVQHGEQHVRTAQQLAGGRDDQMAKLAQGIESSQQHAVGELRRTTDEGLQSLRQSHEESLQSLRRTHEDQSNRLQRVVQEHAGWNRAVLAGVGLVLLGIGALVVLQLVR